MKSATYKKTDHGLASHSKKLTVSYSQLSGVAETAVAMQQRNTLSKHMFLQLLGGAIIVLVLVLFGLLYSWASFFFQSATLLFSGFVCWTFLEYVLHRFMLHGGKKLFGKTLLLCGTYPNRTQRLKLFIVWIAILIMAVAFSRFLFLIGGIIAGWLWYCYMRAFGQWKGMSKLLPALHRQHLYHLAGGHDKGFGWTTTWWDMWFHTAVPLGYIYSQGHGKKHAFPHALPPL